MSIPCVINLRHFCHIKVKASSPIVKRITNYYDFTFVMSGRLIFVIDNKTIVLNESDAVFIPPGIINERLELNEPCEYVSFNFTADGKYPFEIFEEGCITPSIRNIVNIYPANHINDNASATHEKCLCILNYILLELYDNISVFSNRHVSQIIDYINRHITEPMSLSLISAQANLSREYCASLFKSHTGKTVTEYINEQKLLLAKSLIKNGEMSLCDISEYLGYSNYNYFCRLFKKRFGQSPAKVKQNII